MLRIRNDAGRATVYLYGTIGGDMWDEDDENTAREFARTLDGLAGAPLDIRIDSLGGDVYEAFGIASAIQRYSGETTAYVDGVAASAASYVAECADRVVMASFAQLMVHNAWCHAVGNKDEMLAAAAQLESIDRSIAGVLSDRSGIDLDEVRRMMDEETWLSAEEAVAAGLADEVMETERRMAASLDTSLLARYRRAPEDLQHLVHEDVQEEQQADEAAEQGESHADSTIVENEGAHLLVLGNRVYEEE